MGALHDNEFLPKEVERSEFKSDSGPRSEFKSDSGPRSKFTASEIRIWTAVGSVG